MPRRIDPRTLPSAAGGLLALDLGGDFCHSLLGEVGLGAVLRKTRTVIGR